MKAGLMRPRGWTDSPSRTWIGSLGVLAIFLVLYFVMTPGASSTSTPTTIVNSSAVVALAAVGEAIIVLSGGFDLSVGSVLSLVNVVLATHFTAGGHDPLLAVMIAILIGASCGLANGALVVLGRIPTVIATLGTSFIFSGIALYFLSEPGGDVSTAFANMLTGSLGVIPNTGLLILLVLLIWQYMRGRRFGQALYAIGEDPGAARLSGLSLTSNILVAYAASGVCYGIAAACLTAQTATGDPTVGAPLTLTVFAAVVVGGVRLGGGKGSVPSAVCGALILSLISDLLYAAGVSSFYYYVVTGAVLILAIAASGSLPQETIKRWAGRRRPAGAGAGPEVLQ